MSSDDSKVPEPPRDLLSSIPPLSEDALRILRSAPMLAKLYEAIGRVAAAWSYLEALIDTASIEIVPIPAEIGVCFTAQIAGSGRKLAAYISLARYSRKLSGKLIQELDEFAQATARVAERRNRYVHDVWVYDYPKTPQRLEATANKILRLEYVDTPIEKIKKLAEEINDHADKFAKISERVSSAPYAFLYKSPPESAR